MAEKKPEWVKMKPSEVESLVIELAKKGETPEKIGLILRDSHGIPKVKLVGKRIMQILRDAKVSVVSQKENYQKKISIIEQHIAKNKHDYTAQRSLNKKLWIVHKLEN
jgi:small subunit ribosomal protein S15